MEYIKVAVEIPGGSYTKPNLKIFHSTKAIWEKALEEAEISCQGKAVMATKVRLHKKHPYQF